MLAVLAAAYALGRDVFGNGDGNSEATPAAAENAEIAVFQRAVGAVCDDLDEAGRETAARMRRDAPRIRRATTVLRVRELLMADVRRRLELRAELLTRADALQVPQASQEDHRRLVVAWTANLDAFEDHGQRLNAAATRDDLVAALSALPSDLGDRDRDAVVALRRMGQSHCDLNAPESTPNPSLPAVLEAQGSDAVDPTPSADTDEEDPGQSDQDPGQDDKDPVTQPTVWPTATPTPSPESSPSPSPTADANVVP